MKKNARQWRLCRASFAVVLGLSLLVPTLGAKERRGAQVIVTKNDGTVVKGELLTVKEFNLLIADPSTPGGITVSLIDVKTIKVLRRHKALGSIAIGGLVGGACGAGFGYATADHTGLFSGLDEAGKAAGYGLAGAAAGGLIGWLIGGTSRNIGVEKTDTSSLAEIASRLNKYAKVRI